ncbi:hypothetical protein [Mediterraneibacter glycyrrhizinilyticus]|uniref:hypothetical protein n=1 Tax=Mediterraneibacter glycyrrhizinilyticus TaxID=342942 RepID=UPI00195F7A8A|nr:hypothetical protein [Mediterraneibacter glycyrrhizinilyticus]
MLKLKEKFNYRLKSAVLKKFTEKLIDGIMIAQSTIQTDKIGLPRFAGVIPGKPRLEK